ncbi:MAG TPA: hypothetical protein VK081_12600 [Planctomycetota bacterium]|nr:hypothetical protein [Planctomycetota bacterium]
MKLAAILFALAALGGVTLLTLRIRRGANPPLALAAVHGLFALAGVIALGVAVAQTDAGGLPLASLVLFLLAAVGGATLLFGFHLRNRLLPVPIVVGHGMVAATAFVLLLVHLAR